MRHSEPLVGLTAEFFGSRLAKGRAARRLTVQRETLSSLQNIADSRNTPKWIRTINLRFRRPMLYPVELWVRGGFVLGVEGRAACPGLEVGTGRLARV